MAVLQVALVSTSPHKFFRLPCSGPDYPIGWIGYSLGREMFGDARETIKTLAERRFFGRCTEITLTLPIKRIISIYADLVCIIEWKLKNEVKM
jgi:hypothetical protein